MKLIKAKNYRELSNLASKIVISEIKKKPNLSVVFASGKTPLRLYKNLAKACRKGVDFSKIKAFNLDELYPIDKNNRNSFYYYLYKNLFSKINIRKENIHLLNGKANPKVECKSYENLLKKNKIDLMILGVGKNGHIAYNEPGSLRNSKTRLVKLAKQDYKKGKKQAVSVGISTILNSKKLLLLASGKKKKEAIRHLLHGKISEKWPVSFLRTHKKLVVITDS